jgi:hypothetical protein
MSTSVTGLATWDGTRPRLDDPMVFNAGVRRLALGVGEVVEVTVSKLDAATRTAKQNAAYWGWIVRPVALYSKQSLNEIHRAFKAEFLPCERFVLADPKTGDVKLERNLELHTTAKLKEIEFEHYMEQAREFAMVRCGIDMSNQGLWEQFGIGQG